VLEVTEMLGIYFAAAQLSHFPNPPHKIVTNDENI
jgi:hypothetical protein